MDKRRMCPNCRAFITTSDKVCPYCNEKVGPRAIDRRAPGQILGGFIPHARFTTVVVLLINTALFAATSLYSMRTNTSDTSTLYIFGGKISFAAMAMSGDWWRLVTAGFLHGGILHILMNSWVLFDVGAEVEAIYGTSRFIVFYFVSTVLGFLASSLWSPVISIGSSAGIFGLIGAMIAFGVTDKSAMGAAAKSLYVRWAIYGLAIGLLPFFPTDNAAHLGGVSAGFLCGLIVRTPRARAMWKEPVLKGAAGICVVLTCYAFVRMFLSVTGR